MNRSSPEGHAVGNHTFHHLNGWKTAPASYAGDVMECDTLFRTRLFRPPYGRFTPSQYFILRKNYHFVMWSVLTCDFSKDITPDECLRIATHRNRSRIGRGLSRQPQSPVKPGICPSDFLNISFPWVFDSIFSQSPKNRTLMTRLNRFSRIILRSRSHINTILFQLQE